MLLLALLLLSPNQEFIANLDRLAKVRDVAGLTAFLAPLSAGQRNPFGVLKTGGAYGSGKFDWNAVPMQGPDGKNYVVVTTRLAIEDIGDLLFEQVGSKLRYIPETDSFGYRIQNHRIAVSFDLPAHKVQIVDHLTLARSASAKSTFMFRMASPYRVDQILDPEGRTLKFSQGGGIVAVSPRTTATDFGCTVKYGGVINSPQFAGSVSTSEVLLANDYWYPLIARQPAPYRVTAQVPSDWTVIAQGEMTGHAVRGNIATWSYRMDLPCVYFSLGAAKYKTFSEVVNGKRYSVWSLGMTPEQMKAQADTYPSIIEFYEASFGKFPFAGYGADISRVYGSGAMEAYSYATYGEGWLPAVDAHEPSHTWWGGIINNSYLHSFWNESCADFCDTFYHREAPIGNRAERRMAYIATPAVSGADNLAPLADSGAEIGPAASTLGYGRGSFVLQMLEQEIGTASLVKGMRFWITSHPKDRVGQWEDFEAALDKANGVNHKAFFDEWIRQPGYPDFDVTDARFEGGRFSGHLQFKGKPYRMKCEVMVEDGQGSRSFTSFVTTDHPSGVGYDFSIQVGNGAKMVSLDPWRRLLRPIHDDEQPTELGRFLATTQRYTDPAHKNWLSQTGTGHSVEALPGDLDGVFLVGHPETTPQMAELCAKAGFEVQGNTLTYQGTTIDLTKGSALACIDLGSGKRCAIGLGATRIAPEFGRSRLILTDDLGRMLRGVTDPKTSGFLTFRR